MDHKRTATPCAASSSLHGSKLRRQRSSTLCEHASAPVSSFAVEQLQRRGWTSGTGLGRQRDGISTHLRVTKRPDGAGLGAERQPPCSSGAAAAGAAEWWKDSLGDTLAKLSSKNKSGTRKNKPQRHFTDQELFEATGGARFGMRAGKTRHQAKWRRTEAESGSGTTTTTTTSKSMSFSSSSSSGDSYRNSDAGDDTPKKKEIEAPPPARPSETKDPEAVAVVLERTPGTVLVDHDQDQTPTAPKSQTKKKRKRSSSSSEAKKEKKRRKKEQRKLYKQTTAGAHPERQL